MDQANVAVEPIASPWRVVLLTALREVRDSLLLVCPYIKDDVLGDVEQALAARMHADEHASLDIRILTRVRLDDLLSGASDLPALDRLLTWPARHPKWAVAIRALDNLHAKVWVIDARLAIVGSGNLTPGGLDRNVEYALSTSDPAIVARVLADWQTPWSLAAPVAPADLAGLRTALDRAAADTALRDARDTIAHRQREITDALGVPSRLGPHASVQPPALRPRGSEPHTAAGPTAIHVAGLDLWRALAWMLPQALLRSDVTIQPSARVKLAYTSESGQVEVLWADWRRRSIASVPATPVSDEHTDETWAVTLGADGLRALCVEVIRPVDPTDTQPSSEALALAVGSHLDVLFVWRPTAASIGLPDHPPQAISVDHSTMPPVIAESPAPAMGLTVSASALSDAVSSVLLDVAEAHGFRPATLGVRIPAGPDLCALAVFAGPIDAPSERLVRGEEAALDGPPAVLQLDLVSVQEVCAIGAGTVDRWRLRIGRAAEALQLVPIAGSASPIPDTWSHTLHVVE